MAGINQGRPETAIGEPIRFGDDLDFEIEQHPISDRLIIRDTANGKEAYVRRERGGQIGGDGVLVRALREGKPVADDGRTHDTIQQAERAASGFVFVPPGTFNESVFIDTEGLTLRGSGKNSEITNRITVNADGVTLSNFSVNQTNTDAVVVNGRDFTAMNLTIEESSKGSDCIQTTRPNSLITNCKLIGGNRGAEIRGDSDIITNCIITDTSDAAATGGHSILMREANQLVANNIVVSPNDNGISPFTSPNSIVIGNRLIDASDNGVVINSDSPDCIIANNRISDSGGSDINDGGTGTLLDGNLTGPSN
jgi:hypothetical protein